MQHTQQLFLEALKAALKNEQVEWNNKSMTIEQNSYNMTV